MILLIKFQVPTMPVITSSASIVSPIAQIDGQSWHELGLPNDGEDREWLCQCCPYARVFENEKELETHHNNEHSFVEYEECNFCYLWHVWT